VGDDDLVAGGEAALEEYESIDDRGGPGEIGLGDDFDRLEAALLCEKRAVANVRQQHANADSGGNRRRLLLREDRDDANARFQHLFVAGVDESQAD
jgi:hypothetical protein